MVASRATILASLLPANADHAKFLHPSESTVIYDSYAQRALWMISKLEVDIAPPENNWVAYRKFVYAWKALYDRHAPALDAIDAGNYPYRVRIFDKILWMLGKEDYSVL